MPEGGFLYPSLQILVPSQDSLTRDTVTKIQLWHSWPPCSELAARPAETSLCPGSAVQVGRSFKLTHTDVSGTSVPRQIDSIGLGFPGNLVQLLKGPHVQGRRVGTQLSTLAAS